MFSSNGYFKGAYCPFYQYGLCHRPYCHFKHAKLPSSSAAATTTSTISTNEQPKQPSAKYPTVAAALDDDVMKIVKNVPQSSMIEYNRKKQEDKQLKKVLELIDKENRENKKTIRCYSTSSSDGDHASGLVDAFYKSTSSTEIGTFTSHNDLNSGTNEGALNESTSSNGSKKRRICECDDPDCSGFIEEDDDTLNGMEAACESSKDTSNSNGKIDTSAVESRETPRKFSDVDFFNCKTESNVKKKKKKKKKTKTTTKGKDGDYDDDNDDDDEEEEENHASKTDLKRKHKENSNFVSEKPKKKKKTDDVDEFEMVFLKEGDEDEPKKKNAKSAKPEQQPNPTDYISVGSVPTTGQGSGKKRVAHSAEEVIRMRVQPSKSKKLSYVSPGLAAPVKQNKPNPEAVVPEVPASMGFTTETGVYVGKKRVAHRNPSVPAAPAVAEKVKRPKLPMEIGGKIPHLLRQRYLDKIIDEYTPKCESEKVAIEKGFAEEAVANQRSSRKQIYMNLCANIIKKIRGMPAYERATEPTNVPQQQPNPMKTGEPTVKSLNRIKSGGISGYQKVSGQMNGSMKNAIKPVSSGLINAASLNGRSTQKMGMQRRLSEPLELTEENFYNYLQKFLLSDGQLWENKYPRRHAEQRSLAEIKDYQGDLANPLKRTCCRCGKEYYMNKKGKYVTREECRFHWGRLRKRREKGALYSYFSCCESDGNGEPCSLAILHVCERIGPLTDFVSTEKWKNEDSNKKVFSLDCEMCYTTQGLELTRVTVVDFNLEQTVDLFVKPDNPIVDYNTRFSGVTKDHLKHVDTTLENIHEIFMNLFDSDTILMGHSLESDLKALKLIHHKVVDTALVFPHRLGLPFKRALRTLMGEYLQKIIQDGEGGHDSCEDARACMELMKYKFNEDSKKFSRSHSTQNIASSNFYSNKTT